MNSLISRVAYLKGLIEGLGINDESKEGKITLEIVSILNDMAEEIDNVNSSQQDIEDYVESIDSNLNYLEEDLYGDEDDEEFEDDDNCDNYIEFKCPHCNETIYLDKDMFQDNEKISCPNCHNELPIDCIDED